MYILQRTAVNHNGKHYCFDKQTFIEGIYPSKQRALDAFYQKTIKFLENSQNLNIFYNFNGMPISYLFDVNLCKKYLDYQEDIDDYTFIYKTFAAKFNKLNDKQKKDFINRMKYSFYTLIESQVYNQI